MTKLDIKQTTVKKSQERKWNKKWKSFNLLNKQKNLNKKENSVQLRISRLHFLI